MKFQARAGMTAAVLAVLVSLGCESKKRTSNTGPEARPVADAEASAVAELESKQDAAHCRTVLQQLDNLESIKHRPTLSDSERAELAKFLRLTPADLTELGQANFTQTDAAFLEECLLVRSGVRALKLEGQPPLEQARRSFEWVCRMVFTDDRIGNPSNPWSTLHAGSGVALSRAYLVLAVWQQLGLDACLVGPPALKNAPVLVADKGVPVPTATYAPVRACGVRIDKNVFLFDAASGKPLPAEDGKGVLTLNAARAKPEVVSGLKPADEAKGWQAFLAPAMPALAPRMDWLQKLNPGNIGVKLYMDLAGVRARFANAGTPCEAWTPEESGFSPLRILAVYSGEQTLGRGTAALRDVHRLSLVPLELMPKTKLDERSRSLDQLKDSFARPFLMLRFDPNTPTDLIIRGQFQQATTALDDVKKMIDFARDRFDRDTNLKKDFDKWADDFQRLNAQLARAERDDPASVPLARQALEQFRRNPKNEDIEKAFILGSAARPLAAEVNYLMALCIHERAERAQARANWKNAEEWWGRFLDASSDARSPVPAREAHARALLERCRQFSGK
jgi:hypothetical protein